MSGLRPRLYSDDSRYCDNGSSFITFKRAVCNTWYSSRYDTSHWRGLDWRRKEGGTTWYSLTADPAVGHVRFRSIVLNTETEISRIMQFKVKQFPVKQEALGDRDAHVGKLAQPAKLAVVRRDRASSAPPSHTYVSRREEAVFDHKCKDGTYKEQTLSPDPAFGGANAANVAMVHITLYLPEVEWDSVRQEDDDHVLSKLWEGFEADEHVQNRVEVAFERLQDLIASSWEPFLRVSSLTIHPDMRFTTETFNRTVNPTRRHPVLRVWATLESILQC
ncbi:hypothetical protein JCM16303_000820 [Sporobolomyces ruberrimus]